MTGRHALARRIAAGIVCALVLSITAAGVHGWAQAQARAQQKPVKKDPVAKAAEAWPDAKQLADRRVVAENLPLFKSQETLAFTFTSDFGAINRDRDPNSTKRFPGTIQVPGGGGVQPIPVQVSARGHARRDPRVCSAVPIRLEFAKKDVAGTVFEGQKDLKLVTHCNNSSDGEQNVLTEYLTYRLFNAFTPRSFRARLARVTYVDPKRDAAPEPRYGMLLENDEDLARRMEGRLYTMPNRHFNFIEPESLMMMTLLQYMIGNTDFSIMALHNVKLVQTPDMKIYATTYDFDYSGLVNTGYGAVDKRLGLSSVRDRLYRGPCKTMPELTPFLERITAKKDEVLALVDQIPDMKPARRKDARDYLGEFFSTVSNPAKAKRAFVDSCVKGVGM
jgi:hypothetical protein